MRDTSTTVVLIDVESDDDCDCGVCVNGTPGVCAADFYYCSMLSA